MRMRADELSRELRNGSDGYLAKRRGIVALSLTASASMAVIALYQMGLIRHLPEPPLPTFDVANAAKLTVDQWTKHRAFCFWCLLAAAATFAAAPLVVPEAMAAMRRQHE